MTKYRHPASGDGLLARTFGARFAAGHRIARHAHAWHQLVYAREGVVTVGTDAGAWVVPPERTVLVPAGVEHHVEARGRLCSR